ncbi:MAG: DUF4040 domain-containing protein [Rhizobiales bacterium]|nr:DUF4040 domain-containing protein [Hyphomicrobiales bacterium]
MTEAMINTILLTLLAAITIGVVRTRNLFGVVVLASIYSFLIASIMMVLDAVDVAMTEASVGAGISTVLFLGALYLTKTHEAIPVKLPIVPLFVALGLGAMLVIGTIDLPPFGSADQPINQYLGPDYITRSVPETGIPNVVTSVLASYRGYDTLGETAVVFTAGLGVVMLLKRRRRRDPAGAVSRRSEK